MSTLFRKFVDSGYHSITFPHREMVVNIIAQHNPESVLDLGCANGPDLFLLKELFPNAKLIGIDRSPPETPSFAQISQGDITQCLPEIIEHFDVVMTNGVLMYIDSARIPDILNEIERIATKAIVFSEVNPYGPKEFRDYEKHFTDKGYTVIVHKLPEDVRKGTPWEENGYIYEIVKP